MQPFRPTVDREDLWTEPVVPKRDENRRQRRGFDLTTIDHIACSVCYWAALDGIPPREHACDGIRHTFTAKPGGREHATSTIGCQAATAWAALVELGGSASTNDVGKVFRRKMRQAGAASRQHVYNVLDRMRRRGVVVRRDELWHIVPPT